MRSASAFFVTLLVAAPLARAADPFEQMAKPPPSPQPVSPATQRSMQDLQRDIDAAGREVERRAKEEELLRQGTSNDVERYRVEQERADDAREKLEQLDREALERDIGPTPPSEAAARERERVQEREDQDKRTGVVEQKVKVRERRARETPTDPR